jgi:hypothetical protein
MPSKNRLNETNKFFKILPEPWYFVFRIVIAIRLVVTSASTELANTGIWCMLQVLTRACLVLARFFVPDHFGAAVQIWRLFFFHHFSSCFFSPVSSEGCV